MLDKSKFGVELVITSSNTSELSRFIPNNLKVKYLNKEHLRLACFFNVKTIKEGKTGFYLCIDVFVMYILNNKVEYFYSKY